MQVGIAWISKAFYVAVSFNKMTTRAALKNKTKKPLETTLGKASTNSHEQIDLSHVGKTIHTSLFGLRQVLDLFETATEEVCINYTIVI